MLMLMEHYAESVASWYIKDGDLVRNQERCGQWLERAGVRDAWMRPVPVVELHRPTWWNCARAPGRSRPRAGSPRRWKRRPLPRAPVARRAPDDTPAPDSRGTVATPGRESSARCAAGPGAGVGTAGRAGARPYRDASGAVSGCTTNCTLLTTSLLNHSTNPPPNALS